MAISITVEPESGLAIAVASGVLGIEDAKDGAMALWETRDWPGKEVLWDFRAAQFDVSAQEVQQIAEYVFGRQPETPPERVAFVTGRDVDFGMARMFEIARQDPRTAFRVFRDYDEALHWTRARAADGA